MIETRKEEAMAGISWALQKAKLKLLDSQSTLGCSLECRMLHLGSLVKFCYDKGFPEGMTPETNASYKYLSVMDIIAATREMKLSSENWHYASHKCSDCRLTLAGLIKPGVDQAARPINGFPISSVYEDAYCSWQCRRECCPYLHRGGSRRLASSRD
jgi:hypothetical protein